jgi:hypothetical protein
MHATRLPAVLLVVLAIAIAGCSPAALSRLTQRAVPTAHAVATTTPSQSSASTDPYPTATSPAVSATPDTSIAPTATPDTSTAPTSASDAATTLAATPTASTAAANDPITQAIKDVVQRANDEQVTAFTKNDPTAMKDTATDSYYSKLVDTNQGLANDGVTGIKLVKLEWGPITIKSPTSAEVTTFETWSTTYSDGTSDQSRDRNVYTMVKDTTGWKIDDDAHPDSGESDPSGVTLPTSPATAPTPAPQTAVRTANQSRNWSGYVAANGTFTGVSGTWKVPQPTAGQVSASDATWVGIGGARGRDLIQAGTEETLVGSSQVHYNAWIEMLPDVSHPIPLTVNPGDSVTVSINQSGTDQWLITVADNTTGKSYKTTETYTSSRTSAEWIEEAPSGGRRVVPLDNFGTVAFSNATATVNGKQETAQQAGAKPVNMIDSSGRVIAASSALGTDGSSFTVTRTGPANPSIGTGTQPFPRRRSPFPSIPGGINPSNPNGVAPGISVPDLPSSFFQSPMAA